MADVAIVDYGMGNLRSVQKALEHVGASAVITHDPAEIAAAPRLILPGVGAFGAAMARLQARVGDRSLADVVREYAATGRPLLGICLGMQLLLSESDELGRHAGLDLIPGRVRRFQLGNSEGEAGLKVPHMGWNRVHVPRASTLFPDPGAGPQVYFVHSFLCVPDDPAVVTATADHGGAFCAALQSGNLMALQFHPEKSGEAGLELLRRFAQVPSSQSLSEVGVPA